MMKPRERIYYNLFRFAFTQQKLAQSYEDQKAYYATWYFLILWHGVYGLLIASGLFWLVGGIPIPGWVFLAGSAIGAAMLKFIAPSKARLRQLRKTDYRHQRSEMWCFAEMLLINGLLITSLVAGFGLMMWIMSLGY